MNRILTKARVVGLVAAALVTVALPLAGPASANHGDRLLDVDPETQTRPVDEEHTITAHLCIKDTSGIPATCDRADPGAQADFTSGSILIDFELESGPNDIDGGDSETTPDRTCAVNAGESSCSISYIGDGGPGTDVWRVWIDHGGDAPSEADPDEPRNEDNDTPIANGTNCPGAANPVEGPPGGEPDCTDVVQVTWTEPADPPATVDCDDETGPNKEEETNPSLSAAASQETYTCQVRDVDGTPVGDENPATMAIEDVVVKAEVENGINDPDSADGTSYESPDYQCTAGDEDDEGDPPVGQCQINVTQGEGEVGTAEICFWIGDTPSTDCGTEATNEDPNDTGDHTTGNDKADQVEKTWEARSAEEGKGGLDAEPESASNETGENHEITATVYDQFGDPFQGNTTVNFEFFNNSVSDSDGNGPGSPDDSCTTVNSTTCSITYSSPVAGRDLLCVWINTTPTMTGTKEGGNCNGEGLNDGDDTAGEADAPQPPSDDIDVVSKTWLNPDPATVLNCRPETAQTKLGDRHTVRCTATNDDGTGVENTEIDVEFTGANDGDGNTRGTPDRTCVTGGAGNCQVRHNPGTGGETGLTDYRGWIDADYFNGNVESDNTEGRNEDNSPGATAEPDDTDVVENEWFPDEPRRINIHKNKNRVARGNNVRIFGRIKDDTRACKTGETVQLKARRPNANGFRTIRTDVTDGSGRYSFKIKVWRTKKYKAKAPKNGDCNKAVSRTIKVKRR